MMDKLPTELKKSEGHTMNGVFWSGLKIGIIETELFWYNNYNKCFDLAPDLKQVDSAKS
jgi:hypothetical protein